MSNKWQKEREKRVEQERRADIAVQALRFLADKYIADTNFDGDVFYLMEWAYDRAEEDFEENAPRATKEYYSSYGAK